MNFPRGHSRTKVRCESRLFSQEQTPEFTKKGEIHELFVLALSSVWFAGATPDSKGCFPEWCVQRVVRLRKSRRPPKYLKALVFSGSRCHSAMAYLCQAEVKTLKNTVWKTLFGVLRVLLCFCALLARGFEIVGPAQESKSLTAVIVL